MYMSKSQIVKYKYYAKRRKRVWAQVRENFMMTKGLEIFRCKGRRKQSICWQNKKEYTVIAWE